MEKRIPCREELQNALLARCTGEEVKKLRNAEVAVAGLGGLGSHVSVFLVRAGVGHLHLIDFDKVDLTNLNRQHYFISHLGMDKTEALKEQLLQINPWLDIKTSCERVTEENIPRLFQKADIICEAFDRPAIRLCWLTVVWSFFLKNLWYAPAEWEALEGAMRSSPGRWEEISISAETVLPGLRKGRDWQRPGWPCALPTRQTRSWN